ncbi:transposase [Streptomyces nigrescens]|uniref:transposase n=1 Tax=Streptomyces nigrescens TaxID=1920 RepID=UPI003622AB0A
MGPDTAADVLVTVGDNSKRIRSQAAFAKLASVGPIPTSSARRTGTGSTVVATGG